MSAHLYKVKKGEIELETDDKELVMRILGVKEEHVSKPVLKMLPEKKFELRETEKSFIIGDAGSVSKVCVEEVFETIAKTEKPYVLIEDLKPLIEKYSKVYVRRALQILKLRGLVESWRIGQKSAYKSIVAKKAIVLPGVKILEGAAKEAVKRVASESNSQSSIIREGMK